jgi:RNase P/RNase MRP subunit p29
MLLRTSRLIGLLSAALTVNAPAPAAAQGTDTTTERPLLVSKLGLRSGAVVRIARPGIPHVEGRLVRATDHTLVIMDRGSEHTVPVNVADSVWTGTGSTKRGAVIGGLAGLVVSSAAIASLSGMCEVEFSKCEGSRTVVALGVGFAGFTAFLGALAGSRSEWRRRHP